jgi:hypothetical protein
MGVLFVRGNKTYASRHKLKTTMQHLTRYVIHFWLLFYMGHMQSVASEMIIRTVNIT